MPSNNLAATPAVEPLVAPPKAVVLSGAEPKMEDFYRRRLRLPAPKGATKDDARHPSFWGNVAHWLRRDDIVFLFADDGSWELECWVDQVQQKGVVMSIVKNYSRTPRRDTGTRLGDDHYTERRGIDGWCVVRAADGVVIVRGHALEAAAMSTFYAQMPKAA